MSIAFTSVIYDKQPVLSMPGYDGDGGEGAENTSTGVVAARLENE